MTVPVSTARNTYIGVGSVNTYGYTFKIQDDGDILVQQTDASDVTTTLTLNIHYTVTGVGNAAGGSVILSGNLATGYTLTLSANVTFAQELDLRNQGPYLAESVETALDKVTQMSQQLLAMARRALRVPWVDDEVAELPSLSSIPNKFLYVNPSGAVVGASGSPTEPLTVRRQYGTATADLAVISTTYAFTPGAEQMALYINGEKQVLGVDYAETDGDTITLTTPMQDGDVYEVLTGEMRDITLLTPVRREQYEVLTEGQTDITTDYSYVPNNHELLVTLNGSVLNPGDYSEINSTTIRLTVAGQDGDEVLILYGQGFDPAAGGGGVFYPLISAEVVALVSPVDYSMVYGDVRRYGGVGNGVTNDTVACQAALNVARYTGKAYFNPVDGLQRTVYLSDPLTVYSDTDVVFGARTWVRKRSGTSSYAFSAATYSLGTPTALTLYSAPSHDYVTVASVAGLSAGMLALVRNDTYAYGTTGRNQEIVEIKSVAGLQVNLKNRLMGAYPLATGAELVPYTTPNRNITFVNARAEIVPGSGVGGGLFYTTNGYNVVFKDCEGTGTMLGPSVHLNASTGCKIIGGYLRDGQDLATPGSGYAFTLGHSCRDCHAIGVRQKNVRESSISAASFCTIKYCEDEGCYDSSWNTHANGCHDCEIAYNISIASLSKSIVLGFDGGNAGDYRIWCHDNVVLSPGDSGIRSTATVGIENADIVIERNIIEGAGSQASSVEVIAVLNGTRPVVRNNTINGRNTTVRAGIEMMTCTEAEVCDNYISNAPNAWGIIHDNCTGINIQRNTCVNVSSRAVHATTTFGTSTNVKVIGNTSDNDVSNTRVANDIHRDNIYATKFDSNKGATSVADGGTITHGLISAPTSVRVTSSQSGEICSTSTFTSTTFVVARKLHDGTAGAGSQIVYWEAQI